jgi:hypothetical protein
LRIALLRDVPLLLRDVPLVLRDVPLVLLNLFGFAVGLRHGSWCS